MHKVLFQYPQALDFIRRAGSFPKLNTDIVMKEDIAYRTGELLMLTGRLEESVEVMERLFTSSKHYSNDPGSLFNHARTLIDLARYEDALDYLTRSEKRYAKTSFPDTMKQQIHSQKAFCYEHLGKLELALEYARKANSFDHLKTAFYEGEVKYLESVVAGKEQPQPLACQKPGCADCFKHDQISAFLSLPPEQQVIA